MRAYHSCKEYDPELFNKVKENINMQQVVESYGISTNRKGLCICPFHHDKNPSLKIYPNGKGFYCFTCGTGGDQIKFVAMYDGISNAEAAKKLAVQFGIPINIPVTYKEKREAELATKKRIELTKFQKKAVMWLQAYYGLLCQARRDLQDPHFLEAIEKLEYVEYLLGYIKKNPGEVYQDKRTVGRIGEVEGRVSNWYG